MYISYFSINLIPRASDLFDNMLDMLSDILLYIHRNPKILFIAISLVNLVNYLDRGIIPGATNEFTNFILDTVDTSDPGVYIGLLQSSFIVGFALSSLVFGHLVHYYGPFSLAGTGMSVWMIAVCLSGVSYYVNSFYFLLFARMLSGVGEASIQCSIPPWISLHAPRDEAGAWLAIFYTAIPVGTAIGYSYSSLIAESYGWQWAFFIESMIMFPMVCFLLLVAPGFPVMTHPESSTHDLEYSLIDTKDGVKANRHEFSSRKPSVWNEFKQVLKSPIYLCLTFGYAAQTGSLIGISTFGSSFLMGLGFFDVESQASTVFGAVVCVAGIIATPIGGILVDRRTKSMRHKFITGSFVQSMRSFSEWRTFSETNQEENSALDGLSLLLAATEIISWSTLFGVGILLIVYFIYNTAAYLIIVCIGCGFVFLCTPGINIAIMQSVPPQHRAFAIAVMSVCIHAFGDVPSPIIAGLIRDRLAPGCSGGDDVVDDNVAASSACRADEDGLRLTMLILTLWLLMTCFLFSCAWILTSRSMKIYRLNQRFLFPNNILHDIDDDDEDDEGPFARHDSKDSRASSDFSDSRSVGKRSFSRMDDMHGPLRSG